ncbi:MAG: ROK family protein [Deltaproteobacteria bacterium]|nr:ROK family protein [Deltaproteobacteria bacterium]
MSRTTGPGAGHHGGIHLPRVTVDAYNAELRDAEGFLGDRASNRAFRAILEDLRERLRAVGDDPLGETGSEEIRKKTLDKILLEGDPEAAGVVHGAIEGFASELATVTGRFLRLKAWSGVSRIVVGGGLRESRVGELAIGRASTIVKSSGHAVDLVPIRHHPDEAGLLGTIHLAPSWMFKGFEAVLAVDIGGSNIRVGVVELSLSKAKDLSKSRVASSELWRHAEEKITRDDAIARLVKMLEKQMREAEKAGLTLAPYVGIGCPGVIEGDGSIEKGAQNLPGNWESSRFNLPARIAEALPKVDGHASHVVMHNDAVVQGLSELPFMQDVEKWGVLTIGTGLGNAAFANHAEDPREDEWPSSQT